MLHTALSNKLFYNKYKYKLEINSDLNFLFCSDYGSKKKYEKARVFIDFMKDNNKNGECYSIDYDWKIHNSFELPYYLSWSLRRNRPTPTNFKECKIIYNFLSKATDIKTRTEMNYLRVFSNDESELRDLGKRFSKACTLYVPRSSNLDAESIHHSFANEYKYKVTISAAYDASLAAYLETNNGSHVRISNTVLELIKNNSGRRFHNAYYFYARDDRILDMISLFGVEIKRLDKLIPL